MLLTATLYITRNSNQKTRRATFLQSGEVLYTRRGQLHNHYFINRIHHPVSSLQWHINHLELGKTGQAIFNDARISTDLFGLRFFLVTIRRRDRKPVSK